MLNKIILDSPVTLIPTIKKTITENQLNEIVKRETIKNWKPTNLT